MIIKLIIMFVKIVILAISALGADAMRFFLRTYDVDAGRGTKLKILVRILQMVNLRTF